MFVKPKDIFKKIRYQVLSMGMVLMIVCTMLPMTALATNEKGTPTRTTALDISKMTETADKLDTEGWKWVPDAKGGTLTLRNCYIQSPSTNSLIFSGGDVTIMLEGENTIETTSTQFDAIFSDRSPIQNTLSLTIVAGTEDGKLNLLCKNTSDTSDNPYGIAGESITIKSGDVYTNTGFCTIKSTFSLQGGSLKVDAPTATTTIGIYSIEGNVNISGGSLDINVGQVGIFIPGNTNEGERKVNLTGGNVKIRSGFAGIHAKNITINSDGVVDLQGTQTALYCSQAGGTLEILAAGNLTLAGNKLYLPQSSNADKTITIKAADYTKVDEAIAKIPSDLSNYSTASIKTLNDAKDAVVRNKNMTEQAIVDGYAKAIKNAIDALEYNGADYTKVDEALAKAPSDLSVYTDESVKALNNAKGAVVRGKNITEQAIVDGYAKAIKNAIDALEYNGADYTKVDEALAKIPSDLSVYTNESVKTLNEAKGAVVRGKNITEQAVVDSYAKAIKNAIDTLEYKGSDYSKVDEAIAKIPSNLSVYTDASVKMLNDAKDAVVRNKNITEQATVNGYATAIENALKSLIKKSAISITNPEYGVKIEYVDGSPFDDDIALSVTSKPQAEMDKFKDNVNKAAPGFVLSELYDVKLLKNGVEIQPDGKIKVSIPFTGKLKAMNDLKVVDVDDNGNVTIIPSEVIDDKIVFITDHLNYYGMIGKTKVTSDNPPKPNNDIPDTGDNTPIVFSFIGVLLSASSILVITRKRKVTK